MTEDETIKLLTSNVQVRRNNGQCDYGPWRAANHGNVPEWVADMIADEIAENDADSGQIDRAGSIWTWRKV